MGEVQSGSDPVVTLQFRLPRSFRDDLHDAAEANGLSLAGLMRLLARRFLRERLSERQRELLG